MIPLLILISLSHVSAQLNPPGAVKYIGCGYHGLLGNTEGSQATSGGIDPGLDLIHRVLELTYEEGKEYLTYAEPDEVQYTFTDTCTAVDTVEHSWGTRSYSDNRLKDYSRTDTEKNNLEGYEFTLSSAYSTISDGVAQGMVYYDEKQVCDNGGARYMIENAETMTYPLNDAFVTAACALPYDYNETVYLDFLDTWGTDVVVEVNLGQKSTARYDTGLVDFVVFAADEYPSTVSAGGLYRGYRDSLVVDMLLYSQTATTTGGQLLANMLTGDAQLTEPIKISLISMDDVFDSKYWTLFNDYKTAGLCDWVDYQSELLSRQINMLLALEVYVSSKGVAAPSDPTIQTAITWPEGTYGFPEVDTRVGDECPSSPDFTFEMGYTYQDTNTLGNNDWSDPFDLKGPVRRNNIQQNFCNKEIESATTDEWKWMKGEYCIFRLNSCPAGFLSGYVFWDDENAANNNAFNGSVPFGVYNENTLIYYCCREDAPPTHVMYLPTGSPFALIKRTANCPTVHGMTAVSHQWLFWDCSDVNPSSSTSGFHPYETGGLDDQQLHYCVYT